MSRHIDGFEFAEMQSDENRDNYPTTIAMEIVMQDMSASIDRFGQLVAKFQKELEELRDGKS
jgi:hypothetical protein